MVLFLLIYARIGIVRKRRERVAGETRRRSHRNDEPHFFPRNGEPVVIYTYIHNIYRIGKYYVYINIVGVGRTGVGVCVGESRVNRTRSA